MIGPIMGGSMIQVPEELWKKYNGLLERFEVPTEHHNFYRKWTRYYLDFCRKYVSVRRSASTLNLGRML
jgi:hypothetical protein